MNWLRSLDLIWAILFVFAFVQTSRSCWGSGHLEYGKTTPDYDLYVGSELVINCNLKSKILPKINVPVNSTYLTFKRDSDHQIFSSYTHQIDELTSQLRIPNANVNDSGLYHCQIALPDNSKHLVCSTKVFVGYPPKNVSNFKCISRNFDNLTCTWDIEPNNIRTNYTLQKIFLFQDALQNCPKPNNNTFCQWRDDTEPPYQTMTKNLTFVIHGNNSLGTIENEFKFDHFAIVIPNSPEKLTAIDVGQQSFTVEWSPPNMPRIFEKPALFYQLWLEELEPNPEDKIVVDVGIEKYNFSFENLLPNFKYNVSVRCRSNYTSDEDMWSSFTSIVIKTYPDVPHVIPKVNPEAFLIQNFGNYRNVTLYWKPVSKRFYNGDGFYYYIEYNQNDHSGKTYTDYVTSNTSYVRIGHLHNDSSYSFNIHSANKEGVSEGYETIFIDKRNKIASAPIDIRAISDELGFYNLTWSNAHSRDGNYSVFWCAGRKPSYCDGPIQWSQGILKEPTFALEIADVMSNFQFAVAASYQDRSSGMQWASCIVPSKAPLGQIPIAFIEPTSTTLRVLWKLDCDAQKSVIDRYVITYCRENKGCEEAVAEPDVQSYTLKNLHPFSNYSVKLRAFNKENKPSEDIDGMFQTTLSGAPSDPPQNVSIVSKTNSTLLVKWMPPLEPNGIITHYFIYHNEFKQIMINGSSCKSCEFLIEDLKPYTYYNISIEACVDVFYCSNKSIPVTALTDIGDTTFDYDLHVGSDLIVDCNLKSTVLPITNVSVNSSYLLFQKDPDMRLLSNYTRQTDKFTSQLRIPNANVSDSGLYHCQIVLPDKSKRLVGSTNVYIGYPPKNVSNFKCISRNFDNLTCTWDIEPNYVKTTYTLTLIPFSDGVGILCPEPNNDTFCQWRKDTDPPYFSGIRNFTFVVHGNNSLATIENKFTLDHFAIVIPNSPVITAIDVKQQSLTVEWFSPGMMYRYEKPTLYCQVGLEELKPKPSIRTFHDVGVGNRSHTFKNLRPVSKYNVTVRCRSNYTDDKDMWSPFTSIVITTYPYGKEKNPY